MTALSAYDKKQPGDPGHCRSLDEEWALSRQALTAQAGPGQRRCPVHCWSYGYQPKASGRVERLDVHDGL